MISVWAILIAAHWRARAPAAIAGLAVTASLLLLSVGIDWRDLWDFIVTGFYIVGSNRRDLWIFIVTGFFIVVSQIAVLLLLRQTCGIIMQSSSGDEAPLRRPVSDRQITLGQVLVG